MKNFEELLYESPEFHNNNCCINFSDVVVNNAGKIIGDSCFANEMNCNCCRNAKVIMKYFNEYGSDMLKFFPKNYKGFSNKQRKEFPKFIKAYFNNL